MKECEGVVAFIDAENTSLGNIFAAAGASFDIEENEEVVRNG